RPRHVAGHHPGPPSRRLRLRRQPRPDQAPAHDAGRAGIRRLCLGHGGQSPQRAANADFRRHEVRGDRAGKAGLGRRSPARAQRRARGCPARRLPARGRQGPRKLPGICRHRHSFRRPAGHPRAPRHQAAEVDMSLFSPAQLALWTGGRWTVPPTAPLTGFAIDSRLLQAGQIFVALKTDRRDGHDFLPAALAAGATAALVARAHPRIALPQLVVGDPLAAFQAIASEHRRLFAGKVVGISGSCGKTSTKNLLTLLLGGEAGGVLATEGNLNNHLGVPLTLTRIEPARHRFAVVEAGVSAPGEMAPLAKMIEPDLALITLVAPAHLEDLGDVEGVAREKAALPAAIRASGIAVFPKQCAEFTPFRELDVRTLVVEPADVIRPAEPPKDRVFYAV